MPNICPLINNPKEQRAHDKATFNIYFLFRDVLHDVALRSANLQEKDLVVELGPWLDPPGAPGPWRPPLGCLSGAHTL